MASKRRRIIEYLRDVTLADIATGTSDDYNTDPKTIKRGIKEIDSLPDSKFPAIFLARAPEDRENITQRDFKSQMNLAIIGIVKNPHGLDAVLGEVDDLMEDVTKALQKDRRLGGLSYSLSILSAVADDADDAPFSQFAMVVRVSYAAQGDQP